MPAGKLRLQIGLPPVLGDDPQVLIVGSFPSVQSLATRRYYANPQNQFWKIMEELFCIDATLPYPERTRLLAASRIALWDMIGSCRRTGSADSRIQDQKPNPVNDLLDARPGFRLIACNGRTAARSAERIHLPARIRLVCLPSTSPAYARLSLDEKIRAWSIILNTG